MNVIKKINVLRKYVLMHQCVLKVLGSLLCICCFTLDGQGQIGEPGWSNISPKKHNITLVEGSNEYKVELIMHYYLEMDGKKYYRKESEPEKIFGETFIINPNNAVFEVKTELTGSPAVSRLEIPKAWVKGKGCLEGKYLDKALDIFNGGHQIVPFKLIPDCNKDFMEISIDFKFIGKSESLLVKGDGQRNDKFITNVRIPIQLKENVSHAIIETDPPKEEKINTLELTTNNEQKKTERKKNHEKKQIELKEVKSDPSKGKYIYEIKNGKPPYDISIDESVEYKLDKENSRISLIVPKTADYTIVIKDESKVNFTKILSLEVQKTEDIGAQVFDVEGSLKATLQGDKIIISGGKAPFILRVVNQESKLFVVGREVTISDLNGKFKIKEDYSVFITDDLDQRSDTIEIQGTSIVDVLPWWGWSIVLIIFGVIVLLVFAFIDQDLFLLPIDWVKGLSVFNNKEGEERAWEKAIKSRRMVDFEAYKNKFSKGKYFQEAEERIKEIDRWRLLSSTGEFYQYHEEFPNGLFIKDLSVWKNDYQFWQHCKQNSNPEAYLSKYPEGLFARQAQGQLEPGKEVKKRNQWREKLQAFFQLKSKEQRQWERANETRTVQVFEFFAKEFSRSKYISAIDSKIQEIEEWKRYAKQGAFEQYKKKYPNGMFIRDLNKWKEDYKNWMDCQPSANYKSYVEMYSEGLFIEEAMAKLYPESNSIMRVSKPDVSGITFEDTEVRQLSRGIYRTNHPPEIMANQYYAFDLREHWEDSCVRNVWMAKEACITGYDMIEDAVRQALREKEVIPEVGGFLVGKVFEYPHQKGIYDIKIEKLLRVKPESNGEYEITFGRDALLQLDDLLDENKGLITVGWVHTHPGHSLFLSEKDLEVIESHFREPYHLSMEVETKTRNLDTAIFVRKKGLELNNTVDKKSSADWFHWEDVKYWVKSNFNS